MFIQKDKADELGLDFTLDIIGFESEIICTDKLRL